VASRFPLPKRSRLVAATATLAVLTGVVVGLMLALGSGGAGGGLAEAAFPGFRLVFRYPARWHREDWCWLGRSNYPLTLLTTAQPTPCRNVGPIGYQTPLPPPQQLGIHGVAAWWTATSRSTRLAANARLGGRPARIAVELEPARPGAGTGVVCVGGGSTQRRLSAVIEGPSATVRTVRVGAVICGPDFAAGEAQVREMLASVRFTD